MNRLAVIAIGGNSLIKDKGRVTVPDQYEAAGETAAHIAALVADGWDVAVTHGNGPQVGYILRRSEIASGELHEVPLDVCGADTQGAIGYALQQTLANDFAEMGIDKTVATVVTQVEVAADDPGFANPTKPIGSFMEADEAARRRDEEGWDVVEDAGRGWRRVVPSPRPCEVVEWPAIKAMLDAGVLVIAAGGGGVPVIRNEAGDLEGVDAVIDKDRASDLLGRLVEADVLVIVTQVEKVCAGFGTPDEEPLDVLPAERAAAMLAAGEFPAGSMGPKIEAALSFLEGGGREVVITTPELILDAVDGTRGTRILPA